MHSTEGEEGAASSAPTNSLSTEMALCPSESSQEWLLHSPGGTSVPKSL